MKFLRITIYVFALAFLTFSCQEDQLAEQTAAKEEFNNINFIIDENEDGQTDLPDIDFAEAINDHVDNHHINLDDATPITLHHPDGNTEDRYLVDGDVALTKAEIDQINALFEAGEKQYRTNNLVSQNRTISVIGYTGSGYNLTNKMRTALQWAINNYNALNLTLSFSLSYQATTNADIVVYRNIGNNNAGGVAGFPSGGNPYKWVQIYNGMGNYSTNVNEHVITHEIGHCLGLRHTDWFSRQSCGQSGESAGPDGANHIPGTPTGYDSNSVMLACFSSSEDGEFGTYDRVALRYIY